MSEQRHSAERDAGTWAEVLTPCPSCGHPHSAILAGICIGCPCPERLTPGGGGE